MSAAILGNILGRLAISWFLVWTFVWLVTPKKNWREAARRTCRGYGIASVLTLFLLGLLTSFVRVSGGSS
jgi:formate/nitrite transporter FocA (FNT family)